MRRRWVGWVQVLVLVLALVLGVSCSGASQELGIPPAEVGAERPAGLAWWSRAAIDAAFRFRVFSGGRSGYVAAFARDGHPVHATAVGWADVEAERPMTLETPMRFASMTKPITAVAALILIEEGRLGLDDRIAQYVPAFAEVRVATRHERKAGGGFDTVPADPAPTVRHLLMFASGVGPGIAGDSDLALHWDENSIYSRSGSLAERVDHLAGLPLFEQPGSKWRYGGSADVLARVVEVAAREPFDAFIERRILGPLGMASTRYPQRPDQRVGLAQIYTQDETGALVPAEIRDPMDWTPGGSGLVSTAADYMRFALMLWNRGSYDGARILSSEMVDEMTRAHVLGAQPMEGFEGLGWGLGLAVVVDADETPTPDRTGDFWWAGAYSTTFFVSPKTGLTGVILSQNRSSPDSDLPLALYAAQGLALLGL